MSTANQEMLQKNIDNLEFFTGLLKQIAEGKTSFAECSRKYGISYLHAYRLLENLDKIISGEPLRLGVNPLDSFNNYILNPYEQLYVMVFDVRPTEISDMQLPMDYKESVRFLLTKKLPGRERDMIVKRINGDTLQKIGDHYGITRERVRGIIERAISRLRTRECIGILRDGLCLYTQKREKEKGAFEAAMQHYACLEAEEYEKKFCRILGSDAKDANDIKILGLSVRSYNVLADNGCSTVMGIYEYITNGQLYRLYGIGNKSIQEIQKKYKAYMRKIDAPEDYWADIPYRNGKQYVYQKGGCLPPAALKAKE